MSKLLTIFNRSPAKQGDDYQFTIPRNMIKEGIIDPDGFYEIRVFIFDLDK